MGKLYRSLGALVSWNESQSGVTIATEDARVVITLYDESLVRVMISKADEDISPLPYAVVEVPKKVDFSVDENEKNLAITTSKTRVLVSKEPVRISFTDLDGNFIQEEDCGLGTGWIGDTVTSHWALRDGERFIGLGEKTGPLDRRGNAYVHWNTDFFGYPTDADPLYCSTPFYIGIQEHGLYGMFLNNSHRSTFNFGASNDRFASIQAEGGLMDYFFFHDDSVAGIVDQYSWLTGRMELPPKWALGFQQCRYSYYPESTVRSIAQNFRDKKIPLDVIYLDIHYMNDYKVFTFDEERFPDPKKLTSDLEDQGIKTVVIVDPGVKREEGYEAHDSGVEEDIFVKYPDGHKHAAQVWPDWSYFPDFTSEKGRNWWASKMKFYTDRGIRGFWNDMNEPASWGQSTPDSIEFDFEGERTSHREARNVYGMQMSRSTRQGAEKFLDGKRPLMLTRAGFSGVQRYTAVWTGDNVASDEHMLAGVRLLNSMGITGIPFAGYDVGGFAGEASPELFARWISIGAFSPFFRAHSMIESNAAEPWAFGETTEAIARNYINLRYMLMPYIYTAMHRATQDGLPLLRTLAVDYPMDENVYDSRFQNQYFFGDSILVCPVESTKDLVKVYLPEGDWYDMFTDQHYHGNQVIAVDCPIGKLPVFVKRGAPILTQSLVQSTAEKHEGVLSVHIWFASEGNTCLYEDDGETDDHKNGEWSSRELKFDCPNNSLKFGRQEGSYPSDFKRIRVIWHGFEDRKVARVSVLGGNPQPSTEHFSWLSPLPQFDPVGTGGPVYESLTYQVEFENSAEEFELTWESEMH